MILVQKPSHFDLESCWKIMFIVVCKVAAHLFDFVEPRKNSCFFKETSRGVKPASGNVYPRPEAIYRHYSGIVSCRTRYHA